MVFRWRFICEGSSPHSDFKQFLHEQLFWHLWWECFCRIYGKFVKRGSVHEPVYTMKIRVDDWKIFLIPIRGKSNEIHDKAMSCVAKTQTCNLLTNKQLGKKPEYISLFSAKPVMSQHIRRRCNEKVFH